LVDSKSNSIAPACERYASNADVTLNVYTQAMDDSLRTAVDRVGNELFNIVHSDEDRLDSVPLAVSEANRGATGGQPESHE
jgi:hypothetical protein